MMAPPGYPKIVSTFSAMSERKSTSDPEIFFAVSFSPDFASVFVSNASIGSSFYLFSIFQQNPIFRFQLRRFPSRPALGQRLRINQQVDLAAANVDLYCIVIFHECNQSSFERFRRDVSHHKPVRASGESSIRYKRDILSKSGPHDGGRRLEHLRHTGGAAGTDIANDDNVSGLYLSGLNAID